LPRPIWAENAGILMGNGEDCCVRTQQKAPF
jgi:hypothetical protein